MKPSNDEFVTLFRKIILIFFIASAVVGLGVFIWFLTTL